MRTSSVVDFLPGLKAERLRKYRGRLPADFKFDRESLGERRNAE
jgi:hypothetical protein